MRRCGVLPLASMVRAADSNSLTVACGAGPDVSLAAVEAVSSSADLRQQYERCRSTETSWYAHLSSLPKLCASCGSARARRKHSR